VTLRDFDRGMTEQDRDVRQLNAAKQQRHREGVSKAMWMATLDRWVCRCKYLSKDTIPTLDRGLTLASAVPEEVLGMRIRDVLQRDDYGWRKRTVNGGAGLLRVHEQLASFEPASLETGGILHSEPGVPKEQNHSASLWPERSPIREFVSGFEDSIDLAILERKRRSLRHLGWLEHHRGVGLDPPRILAESQEAAQVLQALHGRESGVGPAVSKRPEEGYIKLLQEADALRLAERKQFTFEELATFADGRRGQVSSLGVVEVQLDRARDGRDVDLDHADLAGCFPAVDDGSCSAPFARIQRPLDPLTSQRTLDPDSALALSPATALLAVRTGSSVPTPKGQTAGRHALIVAESRPKLSASFLPGQHVLIGSVVSIGDVCSIVSKVLIGRWSESHPLRQHPLLWFQ
jgi:hypothetical protein